MAARDVRKNFNAWVDGRGYAGQVTEFNAPKLAQITEDFRAGGMVAPIKLAMGMEPLDASLVFSAYDRDVLALWGVVDGAPVVFTCRELLESFDGTVKSVVHVMRGKIISMDPGTSKPGEVATLQIDLSLAYYKLEHNGAVIQEIDIENMIHVANGVDILADQRQALGI